MPIFRIPNNVGNVYIAGFQPNDPGEPAGISRVGFNVIPWPGTVPVINALANNSGTPRSRAVIPEVNRYSPLPSNALFIGGFVGKSQG